jgi:hypothetical protein
MKKERQKGATVSFRGNVVRSSVLGVRMSCCVPDSESNALLDACK